MPQADLAAKLVSKPPLNQYCRGAAKPPRDSAQDESEAIRNRVQAFEAEAERKKKQAEQEVDDMLADLKADLNKRLK